MNGKIVALSTSKAERNEIRRDKLLGRCAIENDWVHEQPSRIATIEVKTMRRYGNEEIARNVHNMPILWSIQERDRV